jgi:[protein-PII] uridylyltransferase
VERRRESAARELGTLGVSEEKARAFFDMMPRRYFTAHTPPQIARHAMVVMSLQAGQTMATAVREMRGGFTEFILCTPDVHGLYASVAGTLTAHDINILGAHVYTTRSGLALESYRVSTPEGGPPERELVWREFESSLRAVLQQETTVGDLLKRRGRRVRPARIRERPPEDRARVTISNEESDFYTIVDVVGNDRLGLLHDLTRIIAEHGLEIYISKAAMILDQVTDTFYLKDADGKKLIDPERIEKLQRELHEVAEQEGDGA